MSELVYQSLTQEQLEREYNPSSNIPNVADLHARRRELALAAQAKLASSMDVAYGAGPLEKLDIFFGARGNAPIQIFFHGGSWKGQDKGNYSFLAAPLNDAGVLSVIVNYDLCPNVTIGELIEECRRSVAWVWQHARIMGGDPNRISVCGHSAGAQIASRMLETDWSKYGDTPADVIKGAVLISGLYDLEPIRLSATNKDVRMSADDAVRESPMERTIRRKVPTFISCGSIDNAEFCRQSRDFAQNLKRQSYPVDYAEAEGHNHFSILEALGDAKHMLGSKMVAIALGA